MEKATYRIIDANFNRGREAMRVIEEFCRFALNSKPLSSRVKQLRHKLCAEIGKLDGEKLLASRDTVADVGTDIVVQGQLGRKSLQDCFTAAAKRLPEALRAISETIQTISPESAKIIEQIRYESYTLEKDVILFSSAALRYSSVKLYVIITSNVPDEIISLTQSCCLGGADCIQLRAKGWADTDRKLFQTATDFVNICRDNGVVSIINDRPDIAVVSDADGLHLGQDDLPTDLAKKLSLKPIIIGKSTHNISQLQQAVADLPTYVGIGPAFATDTKPDEKTAGLDYIARAVEMLKETGIGHAALGGINVDNIKDVLNAGAKTVAVCSAVTGAENPEKMCRKFKELLVNS